MEKNHDGNKGRTGIVQRSGIWIRMKQDPIFGTTSSVVGNMTKYFDTAYINSWSVIPLPFNMGLSGLLR